MNVLALDILNELSTEQLSMLVHKLEPANGDANAGPAASRKILVAYYIPENLEPAEREMDCHIVSAIAEKELQDYCAQQLTTQQSPVRFIALNKFPRLPNGKMSIAALPIPSQIDRPVDTEQGTTSEATLKLTAILGSILGMSDVRADDNFFEIGGDSITAIQFISKAREAGIQLEVSVVSQSQTLAEMASKSTTYNEITESTDPLAVAEKSSAVQFAASGLDAEELDDFLQSFD